MPVHFPASATLPVVVPVTLTVGTAGVQLLRALGPGYEPLEWCVGQDLHRPAPQPPAMTQVTATLPKGTLSGTKGHCRAGLFTAHGTSEGEGPKVA